MTALTPPDDIIAHYGPLFLGSRLKRLAERLQGDCARVFTAAGHDVQPSQFPVLAALDLHGPMTVNRIAEALGLSQPAVTRTITAMVRQDLVETTNDGPDRRHKYVRMSAKGRALMTVSKAQLWPAVTGAVAAMTDQISGSFLEQITQLEEKLEQQGLQARVAAHMTPALEVIDFDDSLAGDFYRINAQWIESMYQMEAADLETLEDPRGKIIDPGGAILFIRSQSQGVIGAVALRKRTDDAFELTKMGMLEVARGQGAGKILLQAIIAKAQEMQVKTLFLLTNRKSQAAIHLYETHGFVHDADIMTDFGGSYDRCDVAMRYIG